MVTESKWKIHKEKLFNLLGHTCVRCGFSDKRALHFDHINGDGNEDRALGITGGSMYLFYNKNPDLALKKLQVLCSNCNWIKRYENREHGNPKVKNIIKLRRIIENHKKPIITNEIIVEYKPEISLIKHPALVGWDKAENELHGEKIINSI